jgi:thiamine-phosphate pyrophosphorylase
VTVRTSLGSRLRTARLYLCTDAREEQGDLAEFLAAALAGGVDVVQIRQKKMSRAAELAALEVAREAAEPHQTIVCVNDSPSLAGAFSADMLHLGQTDGSARRARRHLHEWARIGRSTHAPDQTDEAISDPDVDYFCVGPVWETPTKQGRAGVGLDLLRLAAEVAPPFAPGAKPWFVTGGVAPDTLDAVLETGARRVVVVRALTEAADPEAVAGELAARLAAA